MKTKLTKLMCALFALMVCASVNAQNYCGTDGHETDITWELNGSQLIFEGTGAIKEYSHDMPTAYPWYTHAGVIQTVIIGEGITNIPAWAFAMYEHLVSIHLPSTLKTIGWAALEETILWNVSLPEGLETIEGYAFMMTPFTTVCIPSTVTEIGERAFGYCNDLVSVGCYADVPPTLGSNAFGDCPNIETVYVQSAKVANYKGTAGWSTFGDKIQSPAGYCGPNNIDADGEVDVTKATWSFDMATRTLTIEGTKMGKYNRPWESAGMGGLGGGFNPDNNVGYPQGIYHVVIGEGITAIPASAFYMEVGITDVKLPSTLTSLGMQTFGENFNLATVTCKAVTPPTFGEDMFSDCPKLANIIVPLESVETYKSTAGWSDYAALIQMPNTKVGDYSWVSFFDDGKAYEVDANTTVYKASLTSTTLTLTAVGGNQIISAGNAVVLRSTSAPVLTETATVSTADFSGNELHGSASSVASDGTLYALSYKSGTLGFFKVKNGTSIPAGKAYLSTADAAREYFEFTYGNDATSIESVASSHQAIANGQYYDMQGRKVSKPTKGLYIVNGKKVIVK